MHAVIEHGAVSFRGRDVFSALDAVFPSGAVTALVGPSGSGKSTVLSVLAGAHRLTSGRAWHERDGERRRPEPAHVAWIGQEAHLLAARSVLDNAAIGPLSEGLDLPGSRERAREALRQVGMTDHALRPARTLSGGERQRVAIARALASGRPIILADEPSASLDAANTTVIARLFAELRSTAAVVVATHDPLIVRTADTVVQLRPSRGAP